MLAPNRSALYRDKKNLASYFPFLGWQQKVVITPMFDLEKVSRYKKGEAVLDRQHRCNGVKGKGLF